jgi:peptidyl-prolyl cis-trans isomerase SurA
MSHTVTTMGARTARAIAAATLVLGSVFIVAATTRAAVAAAEQIRVLVNGEPITEDDVTQRLKFNQLSAHREFTPREVVEELTDEKLKLQRARRLGIDVTDADVDEAYANMARRMKLTAEQLTAALAHAGVDAATLKHRIRADIAWQQYVRGAGSPIHLPSLRDQRDTAPRLKDDPPRRKNDDGPTWRE